MFFKKRVEQKKNEMFEMIKTLLPTNATVVSFDYYEKAFGNIVLKFEIGKDTHTFITDRGEIYHNGKLLSRFLNDVCLSSLCELFGKMMTATPSDDGYA